MAIKFDSKVGCKKALTRLGKGLMLMKQAKMIQEERKKFIEENLYHELRCLLGAATVWQVFKNNNQGFDVGIAMDSAFVHARNLFNFFTEAKSRNDISITEFGPNTPFSSSMYSKWGEAINRHLLHISKGRAAPTNLKEGNHLNEQVIEFAKEILSLWGKVENDSSASAFVSAFREARERAIRDAANDAYGRIEPLF